MTRTHTRTHNILTRTYTDVSLIWAHLRGFCKNGESCEAVGVNEVDLSRGMMVQLGEQKCKVWQFKWMCFVSVYEQHLRDTLCIWQSHTTTIGAVLFLFLSFTPSTRFFLFSSTSSLSLLRVFFVSACLVTLFPVHLLSQESASVNVQGRKWNWSLLNRMSSLSGSRPGGKHYTH